MADFAANLYTGFDAGRQRAIQQRDMQRSEQINALLGQAYADPNMRQQALADISRIDPAVAFKAEEAFSGQGDRRTAQIGNLSRTYLAMPAAARGKFAQQYAQDFQRLGLNPADPDFEGIATGYAQAGQGASSLPSDIQTLQMLRDNPDLLAINDRYRGTKSFKEITNADGSVSYVALDNRTGTGGPAPIGAPAPTPAPLPSGTPQMDNLAATANAMIGFGIPAEQVDAFLAKAMASMPNVQAAQPTAGSGLGQTDAQRAAAAASQAGGVAREQAEVAAEFAPDVADAARLRKEAELRAERNATIEKNSAQAAQTVSTLNDVIAILPKATGSFFGQGRDAAARAVGESTEGARATAKLKLLSAKLVANVPRFEGPQSNIDVQFYREAAGDLANPDLSIGERQAAAELMLEIAQRYGKPAAEQPAQDDDDSLIGKYL